MVPRSMNRLAAHVNGAEAQHHVSAGRWPAKAQHRPEAREQQHLIQLMADIGRIGANNNVVSGHLALCIHHNIHEEIMRELQIGMLHQWRGRHI